MNIQYYSKQCNCNGACSDFRAVLESACQSLNLKPEKLETFSNPEQAQKAGVPELPALVINNELVFSGYLPSLKQLTKMLKKY